MELNHYLKIALMCVAVAITYILNSALFNAFFELDGRYAISHVWQGLFAIAALIFEVAVFLALKNKLKMKLTGGQSPTRAE